MPVRNANYVSEQGPEYVRVLNRLLDVLGSGGVDFAGSVGPRVAKRGTGRLPRLLVRPLPGKAATVTGGVAVAGGLSMLLTLAKACADYVTRSPIEEDARTILSGFSGLESRLGNAQRDVSSLRSEVEQLLRARGQAANALNAVVLEAKTHRAKESFEGCTSELDRVGTAVETLWRNVADIREDVVRLQQGRDQLKRDLDSILNEARTYWRACGSSPRVL